MVKFWIFLLASLGLQILATEVDEGDESRVSKRNLRNRSFLKKKKKKVFQYCILVLPIFQVVRFPNDVCTGTSRNGTCYTA